MTKCVVFAISHHLWFWKYKILSGIIFLQTKRFFLALLTTQSTRDEFCTLFIANVFSLSSGLKDGLLDKDEIINLITEFDERKTKEARFAFYCDKLECDLQAKLYDEEGCVDLNNQEGNKTFYNKEVQRLLSEKNNWSDMWLRFSQGRYNYDENFTSVSNYAKENSIKRLINK